MLVFKGDKRTNTYTETILAITEFSKPAPLKPSTLEPLLMRADYSRGRYSYYIIRPADIPRGPVRAEEEI